MREISEWLKVFGRRRSIARVGFTLLIFHRDFTCFCRHVFPASRWEVYDPEKDYGKYTVSLDLLW